jgi:hypothetical protein
MMNTILINKKVKTQYRWSFKCFSKNMLLLLLISVIATILVTTAVKATFDNPPRINDLKLHAEHRFFNQKILFTTGNFGELSNSLEV